MSKPKEIVELEKIYGITLEEGKPNEFEYVGHNTYVVNEDGDVTQLDLSVNQLTEIKGLETLVNLQKLNLSYNQLTEIKGLETLVNLQELNLFTNELTEIKGLDTLVKLQKLNLSRNQLTEIKGLDTLVNLQKLDLSYNQLTEIKGMETLVNLQELDLSYNQLTEIKGLETLVNLQELYLSGNQLTEIKGLETLVNLQELYLSGNQLTEIKGLDTLVKLQELDLSGNQLTEIKGLDTLVKLQELYLSGNQLTEIKGLDTLVNLQKLDLSENQLTEIKGLETLVYLQKLYLSYNQLTEIKGLDTLVKLQELYLYRNQLTEIKGLETLVNLQQLNLSGNQLTEIKGLNSVIAFLKELYINNNPFLQEANLSLEDGEKHRDIIWKYLSDLEIKKVTILLPGKVMFLGNHRAGKSTFWHYLDTGELIEPESTNILNIHSYPSERKRQSSDLPEAIIFDFGGQDYYHGLYRAFFTEASINMLFWCRESDKNDIRKANDGTNMSTRDFTREYWMHQLLHVYEMRKRKRKKAGQNEPSSVDPLLLVQTYANKVNNNPEYGIEDYRKFKNTAGEFCVALDKESVKKNPAFKKGLEYVKESLLYEIGKKRIPEKEGKYYKKFLQNILKWDTSEPLEPIDINTVLEKYGRVEKDMEKKRVFLKVELEKLSRSGIVLYYKDHQSLDDVVWLNPMKTVKTIHQNILSKETVKIQYKGIVPKKDFEELCGNEKIIELLVCEKVIFYDDKNRREKRYIVPGYLPLSSEDEYFQILQFDFTKPAFILKFRYFIPFGLINQLICHYGNNPDNKMFWRDQLIFTFNGEYKVWIKLDFSQLTIAVYINPQQGESPKLKLKQKEAEKVIFLNIMDLYWNREICYMDEKDLYPDKYLKHDDVSKNKKEPESKKSREEEQELFVVQVRAYINEKLENGTEEEIDSPDDMYLSVDGKYFVQHRDLETPKEHKDSITVYPVIETKDEITDATNRGTEKKRKIEVIDTGAPKTLPVYSFKNFSNNPNLKVMKKIFISYSRKDVYYKDRLKTHLNFLKTFEIADNWSCEEINAGKWDEQIQKELQESDLIIYMLSINFFTSPYILEKEVLTGMEQMKANPEKKALCVAVSDFPDLDTFNSKSEDLTSVAKAIQDLSKWQCQPYGREKVGEGTGKQHEVEKIIPLDRYEYDGRTLDQAFTLITKKIQEVLGVK
jgi:internalin A